MKKYTFTSKNKKYTFNTEKEQEAKRKELLFKGQEVSSTKIERTPCKLFQKKKKKKTISASSLLGSSRFRF